MEKRVNNLKWQRLGVLNYQNKPSQDVKDNYTWSESVEEIQKTIADRKIMDAIGSKMGDSKLESYVS